MKLTRRRKTLLRKLLSYYIHTGDASMDMDISMDIHAKSVDMDMDGKFHIHGNPVKTRDDKMCFRQNLQGRSGVRQCHNLPEFPRIVMSHLIKPLANVSTL